MLAAIAAPRSEALEALRIAADKVRALYRTIADSGGAPMGIDDIFPASDLADREADWSERLSLARLTDALVQFDAGRQREGELGKPYYRRVKVA